MTEIVINNTSIDIFKDIPISLNFSIADIRNPEKRNTSFSKTITIPGSKKNNLLFSHIFEMGKESISEDIVNFSPDFNPSIKASCSVYVDTLLQMSGYCQLLKVIKSNNTISYEICIFGVLGDFFSNLDGKYLTDLDFSEYSHFLTQESIEKSWNSYIKKDGVNYSNFINTFPNSYSGELSLPDMDQVGILNSLSAVINISDTVFINNVAYTITTKTILPFVTYYGLSNPVDSVTPFVTVNTGTPSASIPIGEGYLYPCINYGYGTSMYQYNALTMYPSLYFKSYIDKIVKLAGFTYSGNFKDLELFKRLVIPASSNVERVSELLSTQNTVVQSFITDSLLVDIYKPQTYGTGILKFPNTIQDISNCWDETTGKSLIKKAGAYEIIIDYDITMTGEVLDYPPYAYNVQLPADALLRVKCLGANGSNVIQVFQIGSNDGTYSGQIKIPALTFIQGGTIQVIIEGQAHLTVNSGTTITIRPIGVPLAIGDLLNPNSTIPKGILIKDFILSWFKMFNLYVNIDPNNSNNLIIESAKDFYNGNKVIEWSNKLDRGNQIEILPVSEIEGKNYIFAYKEDKDYYNQFYTDTYKEIYGNRDVSVINDFVKGKKEISVVFSPTISADTPLNKMVVPHILTLEDDGTFSPFDSNIRILYYGGLKDCFGTFKIKYLSNVTYTKYPYVGHVDDPFSPNVDLCFEIPKIVYWNTSVYTTANLYNIYYRKFIDEITDKNSKLLRAKFRLKGADIFSIDFRNFIQVDNINYRLNRILDYNPIDAGVCIVELSKIKNGVDYSAYQIDLNPTIAQNLIQGGLDEVRNPFATSYIQLIQGSIDEVQGLFSDSDIKIINGGTD